MLRSPGLRVLVILALALGIMGCAAAGPATPASVVPTSSATPGSAASSVPSAMPSAVTPGASTPAATVAPATPASSAAPTTGPAAAALAGRAWATATLTDVSTGQPFTIAGLAGRTIFVEAMAIWCTNCRAQQARFTEALKRLDPAKVAYVVLTVDPSETAAALAKYRADRGFTGTYAVAGKAVSAALAADFGANALNPPTVPLVLVKPDGQISFKTGGETVEQIIALAGG